MKLGLIVLVFSACTDFADVPRDVCGNGLLEAGEDCDSDAANCVRCAVTCDSPVDCPTADYACGVDGFCHAPGGVLADPTAPVTFQADDLRITDIDRDGAGDVLGVSETSIIVRHGDAAGSLASATSFVTPAQSGPHAFGDIDGDGSTDVTLMTLDGVVSFTSRFGTLSPVAIESPLFDDMGNPLNLRKLFTVGQFTLGAFIEDGASHAMALLVLDLLPPQQIFATAPCSARLGGIMPANLPLDSIDIYQATKPAAATQQFVLSLTTSTGQLCVTSITGNAATGFSFADITPTGAGTLQKRPVLADLDNDSDPCPALVNSDGGAGQLRFWDGVLANGHCTLKPAGVAGTQMPAAQNAPDTAVVVGRVPIDPPIFLPVAPFSELAPDALVLTSGLYASIPDLGNGILELYNSQQRQLAHVAVGDLDGDGDTDAVLSAAGTDDLDVLYRFPLGLQLFRVDTASEVTSVTVGDYDGNGVLDIAYTEVENDHQNLQIAYGTADRPLEPRQVASFSGVSSVSELELPDSVDTLGIAADLAIISVDTGGAPTMSLVHGSPQRTMLSFFDPREDKDQDGQPATKDNPRNDTVMRSAIVGEFDGSTVAPDVLVIGSPVQGSTLGMRAWRVSGTEKGLDNTPSLGVPANGLANCDNLGVCVGNAEYLAWPSEGGRDVVIAVDREQPTAHAAVIDPNANPAALTKTEIPMLLQNLPAASLVRSLYATDLDGDGQPELVAAFAARSELAGTVKVCAMSTAGVPQSCDDLSNVISQVDSSITACLDAAPAHLATGTQVPDLVVLCKTDDGAALYRVSHASGSYVATTLARGQNLRAIRVGDVTGDGVDDVVAIQGSGGSQSVVVYAQCTSREIESCAQRTSSAGGGQ